MQHRSEAAKGWYLRLARPHTIKSGTPRLLVLLHILRKECLSLDNVYHSGCKSVFYWYGGTYVHQVLCLARPVLDLALTEIPIPILRSVSEAATQSETQPRAGGGQ